MDAIDEFAQLADSMRQASALLADEDVDENSSSSRRPSTFFNAVALGNTVTVDVVRGYLHKSLSATVEFIIESEKASLPDQPVSPELVPDWAFEAASQEMRGMCQEAAYQPGLYLTATQVMLKPIVS